MWERVPPVAQFFFKSPFSYTVSPVSMKTNNTECVFPLPFTAQVSQGKSFDFCPKAKGSMKSF